jgi:hypothetical protein
MQYASQDDIIAEIRILLAAFQRLIQNYRRAARKFEDRLLGPTNHFK